MRNDTHIRRRRLRWSLAMPAVVAGIVLAGCGGSSTPTTSTTGSTHLAAAARTTATRPATSTHRHRNPHPYGSGPLAFARCMRVNGVSSYSDPGSTGGAVRLNPQAPGFRTAVARCSKLVPGGLTPATPGSTTHPSSKTMQRLVAIAKCMRAHGVPQFPDPRSSVPANLAQEGIREVTDYDNAILLFPDSLNMQAPAYRQALSACGAPPLGLPH